MPKQSRHSLTPNIWPGFVDALATLLMVLIFLLLMFIISQLVLDDRLSQKEQSLNELSGELASIAQQLNIAQQTNETLTHRLENLQKDHDSLETQLITLNQQFQTSQNDLKKSNKEINILQQNVQALQALKDSLTKELSESQIIIQEQNKLSDEQKEKLLKAQAEIALMNQNLQVFNDRIKELTAILQQHKEKEEAQETQIIELGKQLNSALAAKAQDLSRYRSEFFGRLREILKNRQDIQIVGDRFVFRSEVLFDRGSADITGNGQQELRSVAEALNIIAGTIPKEIDWVVRVDGHSDKVPISTVRFPSNWELSAARAISVVRFFIAEGVSPKRLVAAGFSYYRPLAEGDDESIHLRNRRIELKLTNR